MFFSIKILLIAPSVTSSLSLRKMISVWPPRVVLRSVLPYSDILEMITTLVPKISRHIISLLCLMLDLLKQNVYIAHTVYMEDMNGVEKQKSMMILRVVV